MSGFYNEVWFDAPVPGGLSYRRRILPLIQVATYLIYLFNTDLFL